MKKKRQQHPNRITYEQRTALEAEGKELCGYLRSPYMSGGLPKGTCALRGFQRCVTPQFQGLEGAVGKCYEYDKFMEYLETIGDAPIDKEEWAAYKFKTPKDRGNKNE